MFTSLTSSLAIPDRLIASSITSAPSWVAPYVLRVPLKLPMGVRTALTMTASLMILSYVLSVTKPFSFMVIKGH
jgi:hypothetical protein